MSAALPYLHSSDRDEFQLIRRKHVVKRTIQVCIKSDQVAYVVTKRRRVTLWILRKNVLDTKNFIQGARIWLIDNYGG